MIFKPTLARIYQGAEDVEVEKALKASTALLRLRDVLQDETFIPFHYPYQWAESRPENGNKNGYARTPIFPVGLLRTDARAERSSEILCANSYNPQLPELKQYDFGIILVANTSGGFAKETIDHYTFSRSFAGRGLKNLDEAEESLKKSFSREEHFSMIEDQIADYVVLEGEDRHSSLRVLIEMGNRPRVLKHPKKWTGSKKEFGLVPQNSINLRDELKSSILR